MNCEKNAVVCEGYHEKQIWKSGKERAEEGKSVPSSSLSLTPSTAHVPAKACLATDTRQLASVG